MQIVNFAMVTGTTFEVFMWIILGSLGLVRLRALPGPSWALIAAGAFGVGIALLGPAFLLAGSLAGSILTQLADVLLLAARLAHGLLAWFPVALLALAIWRLLGAAYEAVPYDDENQG